MTAPRHILLALDDDGDLQTVHEDDERSLDGDTTVAYDSARAQGAEEAPPRGVGRRQRAAAGARSHGGVE